MRLAAHYRFSPRTTERQDPESKGKVEALVRFTKSDLIPYEGFGSLDEANRRGAAWCQEVNAEVHYETRARPARAPRDRAAAVARVAAGAPAVACGEPRKVDRLATVRFVLGALLGPAPPRRRDRQVAGQRSRRRDHVFAASRSPSTRCWRRARLDQRRALPDAGADRRPRVATPDRARARVPGLGREAEDYLRAAAAAGTARLHERLEEALGLARTAWSKTGPAPALERATAFGRFAHGDLGLDRRRTAAAPPSSVVDAEPLTLQGLPKVAVRSLDDYRRRRR